MAHEDYEESDENKDLKIKAIHIKILDDGKYLYQAMADSEENGMEGRDYSFDGTEDVVNALRDDLESPHLKKEKLKKSFKEVYSNEPKAVGKTREKHGDERAEKQRKAIAFSKAGMSKNKVFGGNK